MRTEYLSSGQIGKMRGITIAFQVWHKKEWATRENEEEIW